MEMVNKLPNPAVPYFLHWATGASAMSQSIRSVFAIVFLSLPVTTTAEDKPIHIYGLGMSPCGTLVQAFRQDSPNVGLNHQGRMFSTQAHTYQQWLAGFVSSYNTYKSETGSLGRATDINGLMEWLHSYCEKNPTSTVIQAADEMVRSLERKQ